MVLNAMRIRVAVMAASILVLGLYLLAGGSVGFGDKSVIVIEFGLCPEEFEGLEVLIDGQSAGRLQRFGRATRTGFKVKDGDHVVTILHEEMESVPRRITSGPGGRTVMLILEIESSINEMGESEPRLVLTS